MTASEHPTTIRRAGPARVPLSWSAAVALAAAALYLCLAPRVGGEGDGNEFTLVLAVLGVPHPTGYPLYTLLGSAFCRLLHAAGASWWYAANAWSAVGAGAAVFFLHALAARLAPAGRLPARGARFAVALLPTALFAIHPTWLAEATLAEVNSWHLAWVAGACLLCLELLERAARPGGAGLGAGHAVGWGVACGVGLAHHLTAACFALPLSLAVAWSLARAGRLRPALLAAGLAGAVAPLGCYAFVAYRAFHPAAFQWPLLEPTAASVLGYLRGGPFGEFLGHFAPSEEQRAGLTAYVYPVLAAGLPLTALAAWWAGPARRTFLAAALGAAALQGLFVRNYGVTDPAPYHLPLVLVALLGLPAASAFVVGRVKPPAVPAALALAGLLLLAGPWLHTAQRRATRLEYVERRVRVAWEAIPFRQAVVFWHSDMFARLRAYQLLQADRPDFYVVNPGMLTWPAPRREFRRRMGFDPLEGVTLDTDADLSELPALVQARTAVPVVDFEAALWNTRSQAGTAPP